MSDLMEIIKGRRSIRRYEEREIPEQDLRQVLESIQWSPSWANTQCWEVILVKDTGQKQKLQGTLKDTNPAKKAVVQAPVVLVLCGKTRRAGYYKDQDQAATKFGDWFMFDLGIATQSLCLTAHDLGLGTVIVGMFDHDKAKGILGVPENFEVVALIPMGYPAKDARATKRRDVSEFTHHDEFTVNG
jgi:nitroreductase